MSALTNSIRTQANDWADAVSVLEDSLLAVTGERDAARVALSAVEAELDAALAEVARLEALLNPPSPTAALFGVRVFPHYKTRTNGQHAAVLNLLADLGVKRISGQIDHDSTSAVMKFYRDAIDAGIKLWLTAGVVHTPLTPTQWDALAAKLTALADGIELVSGWNEPNNARGTKVLPADWVAQTDAHQAELWRRFGGTYTIGTPQLWAGGTPAELVTDLGKLTLRGRYDVITWHWYMRHKDPGVVLDTSVLDLLETEFRRVLADASSPIVCTESGFFTAPNYTGGSNPVTEARQAALIPQLFDWYAGRGYGLSYFELLDDPDPSGAARESSFGLVRTPAIDPATWTKKPAFDAVRSMLT